MTRRAHLEDGKWVYDETMEAYLCRSFAENQARVDALPSHAPKGEHTLSVRGILLPIEEKGYMKVLDELEREELIYDAHLGLVDTVYARYDSETHTVQCTFKLKEGVMPPYLLDRALKPIEPEEISK